MFNYPMILRVCSWIKSFLIKSIYLRYYYSKIALLLLFPSKILICSCSYSFLSYVIYKYKKIFSLYYSTALDSYFLVLQYFVLASKTFNFTLVYYILFEFFEIYIQLCSYIFLYFLNKISSQYEHKYYNVKDTFVYKIFSILWYFSYPRYFYLISKFLYISKSF